MTPSPSDLAFHRLSATVYRIITTDRADEVLAPAHSPEGRFHHDHQPTLYVSPRPDWAEFAVARYVRPEDPPRVICEIALRSDRIVDLRDQDQMQALNCDPALAAVPWMPERAAGQPASSWQVADRVRASGAEGMIYTSRATPERWHLVVFGWNRPGGADLRLTGRQLAYPLKEGSFGTAASS